MEYIKQMNEFLDRSVGTISKNAKCLYLALFRANNKAHWTEWFEVPNRVLAFEAGISNRDTLSNARNLLKQKGYIEFVTGDNKKPTKYKLIPLYEQTVPQTVPQKDAQKTDSFLCPRAGARAKTRQDKTRQDETEKDETEKDDVVFSRARELPQIPAEIKSAFEGVFRPLAGLKDMERLSCLLEEFGRRGVLSAIAQAKERPQGLERIYDPFSWMRTVLLTEPSPSSRAEGAGRAARQTAEAPQRPPRLRDFTHVDPKAYAEELAQKNKELYERSGGDIYGIFGGSGAARES